MKKRWMLLFVACALSLLYSREGLGGPRSPQVTAPSFSPSAVQQVQSVQQAKVPPKPTIPQTPTPTSNCSPIIVGNPPEQGFTFIIAFNGLSQQEIDNRGYHLARAQFYRSQYKGQYPDPAFGFVPWDLNFFDTRAGLFEIEPFSSYTQNFNVYYLKTPLLNNVDALTTVAKNCTFLNNLSTDRYALIILKHQTSPDPGYNAWVLEDVGTAFNHEIGHTFGLADEYFTTMKKNDLNSAEVSDWNARLSNCDYGRPFTQADYESGTGYCTKWCDGVNPAAYATYVAARNTYDNCAALLTKKRPNKQEWLNFCLTSLDFATYHTTYPWYPGVVVAGNPGLSGTIQEACDAIFADSPENPYHTYNIEYFCYAGSLNNIWNLNIGKNCMANTGCYFGCGGFDRETYYAYAYQNRGAFGDAFRPHDIAVMGGGFYGNSGPDLMARMHRNDNQMPAYGAYDFYLLSKKLYELGIIPAPQIPVPQVPKQIPKQRFKLPIPEQRFQLPSR